jgi:hypothetical protein
VNNVEELLARARAMEPALSNRSKPSSFKRLEPILPYINDFVAIIAVSNGADAKAMGLVWGSLQVLFTVGSTLIQASVYSKTNHTYAVSIFLKRYSERRYQYA